MIERKGLLRLANRLCNGEHHMWSPVDFDGPEYASSSSLVAKISTDFCEKAPVWIGPEASSVHEIAKSTEVVWKFVRTHEIPERTLPMTS